jgi:hypothetical protein
MGFVVNKVAQTGLSLSNSVFPPSIFIPQMLHIHSSIIQGWITCLLEATVPGDIVSPKPKNKKKFKNKENSD